MALINITTDLYDYIRSSAMEAEAMDDTIRRLIDQRSTVVQKTRYPTVGDIVHYFANEKHYAAIVTAAQCDGYDVHLTAFTPGFEIVQNRPGWIPFDPDHRVNYSWHWPEEDSHNKLPSVKTA